MTADQQGQFASVRELYAVEKSLLAAMAAMEARLVAKIEETAELHEGRHQPIDDFLAAEEIAAIRHRAQVETMTLPLRVLRILSENRWVLALLLAALAFLSDRVHVIVQ